MRIKPIQTGMTLVEMMVVVVIIGVLASVAIVSYTKWTRKARAAEVPGMFGEILMKQEAFQAENGVYQSTGANETDFFPAALEGGDTRTTLGALPAAWTALRITVSETGLYCQYVSLAGAGGAMPGGAIGATLWTAAPARNWFYMIAQCDWDKDGADFSLYIQRGDQSGITREDEGQ